jgi:hypothetical protein
MTTINNEAQELLDSRLAVYGERVSNMENVAKIFSGILGTEVRPDQVPLLMIGYKTFRASQTPDYEDNVKDIEGYAIMFREVIGDDMIAAVNTDEYVLEKSRRQLAQDELNKHVRAYNSRYEEAQPTTAQAVKLQHEVPSYQPGPAMEGATHQHLLVYRQQLTNIFRRAWKEQASIVPRDEWAETAAREAVEYFWKTFLRNEELEQGNEKLQQDIVRLKAR